MYICVSYDIGANRVRYRVRRLCRKAGLLGLQKSVLVGKVTASGLSELERDIRALLQPDDRLAIFHLNQKNVQALLGSESDAQLRKLVQTVAHWDF
jgi:CRISPR-associated endonuclease Cas2